MTTRRVKDEEAAMSGEVLDEDKPGTALAVLPEGSPLALTMSETGRQALDAVQQALGPKGQLEMGMLETAKVPSSGMTVWNMSDGAAASTIEGVLVLRSPVRAMWLRSYGEGDGSAPPDCASYDLETGHGYRGLAGEEEGKITAMSCDDCPLSQYGSARGDDGQPRNGQACRQITRTFMLRGDSVLPLLVNLPPSSFKAAQLHTVRLAGKTKPYHTVVTSIGLERVDAKPPYSRATFATVRDLTPDERAGVEAWRQQFLPLLERMTLDQGVREAASVESGE